jgi:hypothetical protein
MSLLDDLEPLSSENALGENLPLPPDPGYSDWLVGVVHDIGTFFKGAYEGVKDNSIVGKLTGGVKDVIGGVKKVIKDVTNTTNLLPVVVLAVVVIAGIYLVSMGKKGKAVI